MASPIILKPLAISTTKALPMVLLLNAPRVSDEAEHISPGVTVNGKRINADELRSSEKALLVRPMMEAGNRKKNVRLAFLEFAKNTLKPGQGGSF